MFAGPDFPSTGCKSLLQGRHAIDTCRSLCLSLVALGLWLFFPLVGVAQNAKPPPEDIYKMAANSVASIEAYNDAEGRSELASGFVLMSEGRS